MTFVATALSTKNSFSQSTLEAAFISYAKRRKPQDTDEKRQDLMNKAGIMLEAEGSFETQGWSFERETFDDEVERMLTRIRYRAVCSAE